MSEILGIDHIYVTVSDLARSELFYDRLMAVLGFRKRAFTLGAEPHIHYHNRHFGYVLRPARSDQPHNSYAAGLHHLCLRVESIEDVAALATALKASGLPATDAARFPDYAPDYWATFVTDPDGIRLEITNYRQERRDRHDHWDESS